MMYTNNKIAEGLCVGTQTVEKVKPDSLNLLVHTIVGKQFNNLIDVDIIGYFCMKYFFNL